VWLTLTSEAIMGRIMGTDGSLLMVVDPQAAPAPGKDRVRPRDTPVPRFPGSWPQGISALRLPRGLCTEPLVEGLTQCPVDPQVQAPQDLVFCPVTQHVGLLWVFPSPMVLPEPK
jgi:hypothetical protein